MVAAAPLERGRVETIDRFVVSSTDQSSTVSARNDTSSLAISASQPVALSVMISWMHGGGVMGRRSW